MKKNRLTIALALATLAASILAPNKTSAAARAAGDKLGNGATAPWEKTAGPPGITTNVIFGANNVVYAGTRREYTSRPIMVCTG